MKKLQNYFTTPEQSKRLLKLGVPADSADCVLENLNTAENNFQSEDYTRWIIEERHVKEDIFCERNEGIFLPCWSVGRLMEIIDICDTIDTSEQYPTTKQVKVICEMSYVEYMVKTIEIMIKFREVDLNKIMEE